MNEDQLEGTVIPATRGPIKERADGTLTCLMVIQRPDKAAFLKLLPDVDLPIFLVRAAPEAAKRVTQDATIKQAAGGGSGYGQFYKRLRLHVNFMGNPRVWEAVGTDAQFLEWCRRQPCAACASPGDYSAADGTTRCQAAHVRRVADGAGTSIKPPYSAIALCASCHTKQHRGGENAMGGKEWFDKQRMGHLHQWVWESLRDVFGVDSLGEVEPEKFRTWAEARELGQFLPACFITGDLG